MKKFLALALLLAFVLALAACDNKNLTFDIGEANTINIKSGLTGAEVNISDKEFIQNITDNINSLRLEKTSAADGKVGYAYMLTWFDTEDKQIARITITEENGYKISHDGYFYKVGADLCIDTKLIDEVLNISLSSTPKAEIRPMEQLTLDKVIELSVKSDGFVNIEPAPICRLWDAKSQALNECTIEYDTVTVAYDEAAQVWEVIYSTANTLGNCQSVYMDRDGVTQLIVYGE